MLSTDLPKGVGARGRIFSKKETEGENEVHLL